MRGNLVIKSEGYSLHLLSYSAVLFASKMISKQIRLTLTVRVTPPPYGMCGVGWGYDFPKAENKLFDNESERVALWLSCERDLLIRREGHPTISSLPQELLLASLRYRQIYLSFVFISKSIQNFLLQAIAIARKYPKKRLSKISNDMDSNGCSDQ